MVGGTGIEGDTAGNVAGVDLGSGVVVGFGWRYFEWMPQGNLG